MLPRSAAPKSRLSSLWTDGPLNRGNIPQARLYLLTVLHSGPQAPAHAVLPVLRPFHFWPSDRQPFPAVL